MRISLINSLGIDDTKEYCGNIAGICYGGIDSVKDNNRDKAIKRAEFCLKNGHHSIYEHKVVCLHLVDVPKILCMYLNSMGSYATTEKSGRYTNYSGNELYNKWYTLIYTYLKYTVGYKGKNIETIARENARYMLSIFDVTDMVYTINIRQLNYLMGYMENYKDSGNLLDDKLIDIFNEFISHITNLGLNVEGLRDWKRDSFNFNTNTNKCTEWDLKTLGNMYEANYTGSFVYLAQAQRHRTLEYRYSLGDGYYIPDIIYSMGKDTEWITDLQSISESIPQARLLNILELGTIANLKLKADERLCGDAQHEIMRCTKCLVYKLKDNDIFSNYVKDNKIVARCLAGYKCKNVCAFGGKYGVSREY